MFRKPFSVKSNVQLKTTEKKRLRDKFKEMGLYVPESRSAEVINELFKTKSNVSVSKVTLHTGEKVLVYYHDKSPIAFSTDPEGAKVFPTVEMLWKVPDLAFTYLVAHSIVLEKLKNGADLMLPGLVFLHGGSPTVEDVGNVRKGCPCAVSLLGEGGGVTGCMAVGETVLSAQEMLDSGMKGKGVKILHNFQDTLWDSGARHMAPTLPLAKFLQYFPPSQCTLTALGIELPVPDNNTETSEATASTTGPINAGVADMGLGERGSVESAEEEEEEITAEEIETNLINWFLLALKKNIKQADLPVLFSDFFNYCLKPVVPRGQTADLKLTRFKKVGVFFKEMETMGYIEIKEKQKDVQVIANINWAHPDLKNVEIPSDESDDENGDNNFAGGLTAAYSPPVIDECFSVTAMVLPVLSLVDPKINKGTELMQSRVKELVTEYVKANQLQKETIVQLDPHLSDILKTRAETAKWAEVFNGVLQRMTKCFRITWSDGRSYSRKSKIPKISMKIEKRMGNKKVTLVDNLSVFGIREEDFASKVRKGVACSTSLSPAMNPNEGQQVLVQGNQITFVDKILSTQYGIPRKYIVGTELAVKTKKTKR